VLTWRGPGGAAHGRTPGAAGVGGGSGEGRGSCGATDRRGLGEVARHGLQRHRVSAVILVFHETSGRFYQKEF